jgi:hypothetical protein
MPASLEDADIIFDDDQRCLLNATHSLETMSRNIEGLLNIVQRSGLSSISE